MLQNLRAVCATEWLHVGFAAPVAAGGIGHSLKVQLRPDHRWSFAGMQRPETDFSKWRTQWPSETPKRQGKH